MCPDRLFCFTLSGGIDSAIAAYCFLKRNTDNRAIRKAIYISRRVEQSDVHKAYSKEIEFARKQASKLNIPNEDFCEIHLPFNWYVSFKQKKKDIFPYGRNLIYLAVVASYCAMLKSLQTDISRIFIVVGFNKSDGHDGSEEFLNKLNEVIHSAIGREFDTQQVITVEAPFIHEYKEAIIKYAYEEGATWFLENSWSCYGGGESHCGECEGCKKRKEALQKAWIKDPVRYKIPDDVSRNLL
ncbi:MAG: 7-cyano-7-deazaguanine synthase [Candidatus Woesearchaeota archaeon]